MRHLNFAGADFSAYGQAARPGVDPSARSDTDFVMTGPQSAH
jgi:hypothetical protein